MKTNSEVRTRLEQCFAAVFPGLSIAQIETASPSTVPDWDSVAAVTLVATIEEEFGFEIDMQDMVDLVSFQSILTYLQARPA